MSGIVSIKYMNERTMAKNRAGVLKGFYPGMTNIVYENIDSVLFFPDARHHIKETRYALFFYYHYYHFIGSGE